MQPFDNGDIVRCMGGSDNKLLGARGRVIDVSGNMILVEWDGFRVPQPIHTRDAMMIQKGGSYVGASGSGGSGGMSAPTKRVYQQFMTAAMVGHAPYSMSFSDTTFEEPKKPAPKIITVDPAKMDGLIMDAKTKGEILSVLKQHSNHKKIFKDWGLEDTIEYGIGMTFLFHGPPGTGKTWAANLMAKSIGAELLTIGMAEIQSSEPGAANRNIQNAFKECTESGKVLFIDECDSLIFDRKHLGMVLAGEVNTLLQEIEKFEGVLILATNQINRMDAALERRISLIVKFANPNFEQRKDIWQKLLPKKLPLHKDVVLDELASHEMSGGLIKNAILHAARAAASDDRKEVSMEHFLAGIMRIKSSKNIMGKQSGQNAILEDSSLDIGVEKVDNFFRDVTSVTKKTNEQE